MTPRERAEAEARGLFRVSTEGGVTWVEEPFGGLRFQGNDEDAEAHVQLYGEPIADAIERAILADRAERAAGEAERTAQAVAAERERVIAAYATALVSCLAAVERCDVPWVVDAFDEAEQRARATSPAPVAHPAGHAATDAAKAARARGEDVYADGEGRVEVAPVASAERGVIEAAEAFLVEEGACSCGYQHGTRSEPCSRACRLQSELQAAIAAARKDGAR